ncbi:MAG: hypothetical protein M1812_007356 [Candelaria pacifica]|nr:MAG: hypothetical protein M1812_007356 [Candelaria pacifica]
MTRLPASSQTTSRSSKLAKHFNIVLHGKQPLQSHASSKLFLEAICEQPDHSQCIEKFLASSAGPSSLQMCFRSEVSPSFMNNDTSAFLRYLQEPLLKQLLLTLLDKALGRVLFIDEAYRLAEGQFGLEAVNELVDCLTKARFAGKLVTILAGYDADINRLISINPGLSSRFPEEIIFEHLSPEHCLQLLGETLKRRKVDDTVLHNLSPTLRCDIMDLFGQLSSLPSWGNARDVQHLAKAIFNLVLKDTPTSTAPLFVSVDFALQAMRTMVSERTHRVTSISAGGVQLPSMALAPAASSQEPPTTTRVEPAVTEAPEQCSESETVSEIPADVSAMNAIRDAGISDEIWQNLAKDKESAERTTRQEQSQLSDFETELRKATTEENTLNDEAAKFELSVSVADKQKHEEIAKLKRKQEEARLAELKARLRREQALQDLENALKIAEARKREEAAVQAKLRNMGVCFQGFQWNKQSSGYQCAGGSHFIGNEHLGL